MARVRCPVGRTTASVLGHASVYLPVNGVLANVDQSDVPGLLAAGYDLEPFSPAFVSAEQTGSGSQQSIAHGLGVIPAKAVAFMTGNPASPGASSIAQSQAADAANVYYTVTANFKYIVLAWAA